MIVTIYTLANPKTGEIRYVGKTVQKLYNRVNLHIQSSKRSTKTKVCAWIKGLLNEGLRPNTGKFIKTYISINSVAKEIKGSRKSISNVCKKNIKAYNSIWKFKNDLKI